jgi:outer membrane protein OmpA-like peptidoglycan-associated protein
MKKLLILVLALGIAVEAGGCATRRYVRNEVKTSTDRVSGELTAKIDANQGEIRETQDAVSLVGRRVTGVDQRVTVVDEKVANVDQHVNRVDQKVATVDTHVAAVENRVDAVDQTVARVDEKVAKVDDGVKAVGTQVATLDVKTTQQIAEVHKEVGTVDEKTERAMEDINVLDGKFEGRNNLFAREQHTIQFGFDKDKLDPAGIAELDAIAAALMADSDAIVVLEGRTDSTGDRDYNIALGERRVEQARRYLAVDKNIPVYRIFPLSLGTARPIADNKTA